MSALLQVLRLDRNVDNLASTASGGGPLAMGARAQANHKAPPPAAASDNGKSPNLGPVCIPNIDVICAHLTIMLCQMQRSSLHIALQSASQ